ncbi:MAG: hypothetical protein HN657_06800 [Candidatus Marinimicrobia bacterium]|jgi:hypothetical protein|nr:hypothetical protein [Candidatus Neomarinimicrobiota bacterium]MBT3496947.1 hypothetical protein [Candidatus Neomarinimicrobiota bacterium]MBT3692135.1 hypothetical protein [Candidatus Neomarinimicrobiota bacterium]MBT3732971.1 hypothetical protein [Candidatus Neomarinimicrobiota bacterium]MBT4143859.1 hypothetical protein [Candidatus Neomarinimicrobiota bacterium]
MKKKQLFEEFEMLSEKLGVKIIKGKGNFVGGTCHVNDEKVVVINKSKPIEQHLRILAISFLEWDLEGIFLVPALRAYIDKVNTLNL